ncbi:MAG: terpene cyclase/mutase family protein [Actinomycetota bacterium]|nr:terpene cyclase/mutase family protein [Actinomycetota bacterium]
MATYGGDLSLRHFLVLEARAIPFEVAHVLGNVVLALIAGPAMVRMLVRFRERFEWQRRGESEPPGLSVGRRRTALRGGGIAALLLAVFALGALAPAPAEANSVTRAADWLETQQRPSGGFAASAERDAGAEMTGWTMLGLAAAGRNPLDVVSSSGKTPVDFLRNHLDEVRDAGDFARTILALTAAGVDPRDFKGEDLVDRLLAQRRDSGSYQGWPGTSAYAVLALRAAGANDAAAPTVAWLRKVQGKDGGWGNEPGDPSTAEITGAVLQVLTPGSEASDRALAYLRQAKRPNGGFAPGNNLPANGQATAWASQGLLAVGKDPASFSDGKSSFTYMRELQTSEGYFLQSPGLEASPVWVTADVLVPLAGHHLPVSAPPREPKPNLSSTGSSKRSGGVTPSSPAPSASEVSEAFENFPGGSGSGSGSGSGIPGGSSPKGAAPGGGPSGAVPSIPFPGEPEGDLGVDPEASELQYGEQASQGTSDDDSDSSTAGAIVAGLLAGSLLFGAGLAGRRGWMRWRYGL